MKHIKTVALLLLTAIVGAGYVWHEQSQQKAIRTAIHRTLMVREVEVTPTFEITDRMRECLSHTVGIALATGPYEVNEELIVNDYRLCMTAE